MSSPRGRGDSSSNARDPLLLSRDDAATTFAHARGRGRAPAPPAFADGSRTQSFDVESQPLKDDYDLTVVDVDAYQVSESTSSSGSDSKKEGQTRADIDEDAEHDPFAGRTASWRDVPLRGITGRAVILQFLSGILFGYGTGVIAGANLSIDKTFDGYGDTEKEIVTASILLGGMVGSFFTGSFADAYGRRPVTIFFSWLAFGSSIYLSLAPDYWNVVVARFLLGLVIGGLTYVCPLYCSETSIPAIRGFTTMFIQASIVFFIFFSYLLNLAFQNVFEGWRFMFGFLILPSIAIVGVSHSMSESPRWLVLHGRDEEARPLLGQFLGKARADSAIISIRKSNANKRQANWCELFHPRMHKHMAIGVFLALANQLAGNNAVTYYAPIILGDAGFDGDTTKELVTLLIGLFKFLCLLIAFFSVERLGRRKLMLSGLLVMGFGALVVAIGFLTLEGDTLAYTAMVCLMLFVGGYEIGPGPMFFVVMSEVYPDKVRGRAMSLINGLSISFNFMITLVFLDLTNAIGRGQTFFCFFAVIVVSFVGLAWLMPETKGRTLEQIQLDIDGGKLLDDNS